MWVMENTCKIWQTSEMPEVSGYKRNATHSLGLEPLFIWGSHNIWCSVISEQPNLHIFEAKNRLKAVQTWLPWQPILQSFEKENKCLSKKREQKSDIHFCINWTQVNELYGGTVMYNNVHVRSPRVKVRDSDKAFAEAKSDIQICSWAESMALKFRREKDGAVFYLCGSNMSRIRGT